MLNDVMPRRGLWRDSLGSLYSFSDRPGAANCAGDTLKCAGEGLPRMLAPETPADLVARKEAA